MNVSLATNQRGPLEAPRRSTEDFAFYSQEASIEQTLSEIKLEILY